MEIKDLEKPVKLTVTVENGKLLHAFLLQCINYNVDIDKQFNNWIKNFLNIMTGEKTTADLFAEYFIKNCNKDVTKMELRALNFVQGSKFKDYYNSIYGQIVENLNERGYNLVKEATKYGGTSYTCKSIKEVCNNG